MSLNHRLKPLVIDLSNVRATNMDYDPKQYPEFEDSSLVEAEWIDTGKELTEEEVDSINDNHYDWVYESLQDYIW
jgi:hypothetical protein